MTATVDSALIAECSASEGYRLRYRVWPATEPPAALLVILSGMMSHSGWFGELASRLAGMQVKVVGADRRGSGLNECGRGDTPSREVLLDDLRRIIEQERCGTAVYIAGWCWGAVLAVNAALEFGREIKGVLLLAPGLFPSAQVQGSIREEFAARNDADPEVAALPSPITPEMFTDSAALQDYIRTDPLAVRRFTPNFFRVARGLSWIAAARLARLTQPVLLLLAGQDQAADNARTLREFDKLPAHQVTAETLAANHGMQLERPRAVAEKIAGWLHRHSSLPTQVANESR